MAKSKSLLDVFVRDFTRGLGRQGGFRAWKTAEKAIAAKVFDPNSKFRKKMNSLSITSTMNGSLKKIYEIIDLFYEEYGQGQAILQKSFYFDSDIEKIERKLLHLKGLIKNNTDDENYKDCLNFWFNVKNELNEKK